MTPFETFLQDLDRLYAGNRPAGAARVGLRILGSVALMIQAERDIFLVPETPIDLRTNPYETED